ncbi:3-oxoadipate enol-lactonase [Nocardioides currus]|uniref:3-oxoadipate enol-lactonase n=1 Tax=Nocardioides currus TaxID=2133958 RepID=A0A2R7Z296_9ACTN|nr:3-oxoadipate enol-lactonase [Nocardioides currus]PUA82269.1 3-oxoadipate enol-lactonase [Nocardioides currus]
MTAVTVHHVVTGRDDAPVVVLSNSMGADLRMWDGVLGALEEHFRVVRYDTRGHGQSPEAPGPYSMDDLADDYVALLDTLGVDKAHLVGLSLGGMMGMRLAARDPERVDRLVLLCTGAHLEVGPAYTERAAQVRAQGTGSVAEGVVNRWFTPAYLEQHPGIREHHEAMCAATSPEGYAGSCEAIAAMDLRPDLAQITAPTLAIAGEDDPATPPAYLREIADGVADGALVVVPDAAHLAAAQQPQAVAAAILEHLGATS